MGKNPTRMTAFLQEVVLRRIARLTALCQAQAKPYTDFDPAKTPFDWYRSY